MASLIEELLEVLENENSEYEVLLELSERKTPIIIKGDVTELQKITDEEQSVVNRINRLEQKRIAVTNDIANVINKDVETLKISALVQLLDRQPKEQERLAVTHDKLQSTVRNIKKINEQNAELIKQALDMVQFDMNLIQAMKKAPETANYNKGAINAGGTLGSIGGFDAKQ